MPNQAHGHTTGSKGVVGTDDLEVEGGADPHGVCVDQFLSHEGATVAAQQRRNRTNLSLFQFSHKGTGLFRAKPLDGLVLLQTPCGLMEVVQAVAPLVILFDDDGVDGDQLMGGPAGSYWCSEGATGGTALLTIKGHPSEICGETFAIPTRHGVRLWGVLLSASVKDNPMPQITPVNAKIPDGKYVARLRQDYSFNVGVVVEFELTTGGFKGELVYLLITTAKAKKAVQLRSGGWLEWLSYDGDAAASKVENAKINSIDGQFFVQMKGGLVKTAVDPTTSESSYLSMFKEFAKEWVLSNDPSKQLEDLKCCQAFYEKTGRIPNTFMNYFPKEEVLGKWLDAAIDPKGAGYFHEANLWVNDVFKSIGGSRENVPKEKWDWPKLWFNKGFDRLPPEPR